MICIVIYHFCLRRWKLINATSLQTICLIKKYFTHIKALKEALNHWFILKEVQRVIRFNQKGWLKPYIDMNTKLRREVNSDFEKDFFELMTNTVFGKNMKKIRNYTDW